jgi:steroid delta-isomerase-like uncharacterized protein
MSEANKTVIRRIIEESWNKGNVSLIDELFTPDYTGHFPPETMHGPAGYKKSVITWRTAMPDFQYTIEDMIADGDKVAIHGTVSGTHTGEGLGIAPTGRQWISSATSLVHLAGGKLVEEWINFDALGLLQQLGVVTDPAVAEANKSIVRRYVEEILNQGNLALIDELFSADSIIHGPYVPELRGREARKQYLASLRKAFPDLHYILAELSAEGDRVVMRWSFSGTHRGEWLGVAATGKKVSISGTTTLRIADGMITEEFVQADVLSLVQQIGVVTDPAVAEVNKAVACRYIEEVGSQGNLAIIDELFSPDSIYHGPNFPELRGREARKQHFVSLRRAFPDLRGTVDEVIAQREKVVLSWSLAGTHKGEFWGAAPTGKKVSCSGTSTFLIADRMITDEYMQWDALGFMQQLGVVPALSQPAGAAR